MREFLIKLFWIGGIILFVLAVMSFYVRYKTLKYDLRPEKGDFLKINL